MILFIPDGKITSESVNKQIKEYLNSTGYGDEWVRVGSLKVFLDGGILTGTAYMQDPWRAKAVDIFGIEDPSYRGNIN